MRVLARRGDDDGHGDGCAVELGIKESSEGERGTTRVEGKIFLGEATASTLAILSPPGAL